MTDYKVFTIDDAGKCSVCGLCGEDRDLHIIQLHEELTRLRAIVARVEDVEGVGQEYG